MDARRPSVSREPSPPPGRSGGREHKLGRKRGLQTSSSDDSDRKGNKFLDRFASIRMPGTKKERPHLPLVKSSCSSTSEWPSSSPEFDDVPCKQFSEKEILALFEKMMEDMNLNEDRKAPLRGKDFLIKKEMVMQYISSASRTGSFKRSRQISPHEFIQELKSGFADDRLVTCLESLKVSLTNNPVR